MVPMLRSVAPASTIGKLSSLRTKPQPYERNTGTPLACCRKYATVNSLDVPSSLVINGKVCAPSSVGPTFSSCEYGTFHNMDQSCMNLSALSLGETPCENVVPQTRRSEPLMSRRPPPGKIRAKRSCIDSPFGSTWLPMAPVLLLIAGVVFP